MHAHEGVLGYKVTKSIVSHEVNYNYSTYTNTAPSQDLSVALSGEEIRNTAYFDPQPRYRATIGQISRTHLSK